MNKMALEAGPSEDSFLLKSIDPQKPTLGFICQTSSPELLEQWLTTIRNILQTQKDFLKAIQSPIAYQKELTKEAWVLTPITVGDANWGMEMLLFITH